MVIGVSHLIAHLTRSPGNGFLGSAEPIVFVVACALLLAVVVSIPYLRETTHPGVPPGSTMGKRQAARIGEGSRR